MSKQISWRTEEAFELGCFEEEEAPKKFVKYGKFFPFDGNRHTTSNRILDLPVKLGDELSNLKIPNYSFYTEFVFDEEWEPDYLDYRLVTNSDTNLFPNMLTYGVEPTPEGIQSLLDLFKENNMENTIPNFSDCVLGDFDDDGSYEIIVLNTLWEGGYSLAYSQNAQGVYAVVMCSNWGL